MTDSSSTTSIRALPTLVLCYSKNLNKENNHERSKNSLNREHVILIPNLITEISNEICAGASRPDDGRPKKALEITAAGELEARNEFLCYGGAADDVPALEDGDGEASACQVCCGCEAIVATANDQRIPLLFLQSARSVATAATVEAPSPHFSFALFLIL